METLRILIAEDHRLFREREILHFIAQGDPNPSIARQLSLSTKTVGNYVSNVFTKLQVADRTQAIIRAREAGLGQGKERQASGNRCQAQGA